jgi:hypothetical protein
LTKEIEHHAIEFVWFLHLWKVTNIRNNSFLDVADFRGQLVGDGEYFRYISLS